MARVHILARKPLLQNARIHKQAASLSGCGYEVTLIGPRRPGRPAAERVRGALVLRVGSTRRGRLGALVRYLAFLRAALALERRIEPPHVVHCNDLDTLPLGLLIARRCGAAVVYDVQDLYPDQDHIPRWLAPLLRLLERLVISRADRVIAVNDLIAGVLRERYGASVDAVVLNCPPLIEGPPASGTPTIREALAIPQASKLVVYSGILGPNRGLEHTILALRELPEVCLVLLGEGVLRATLEKLAMNAGVAERVRFSGFVEHTRVPAFIGTADIGIVPYERVGLNYYLCSPSKLFHYLMAELPVACSDFPFLRRIVLGQQLGTVFDPADPSSIAAAIRRLPGGLAERDGYRERLRGARRRYCWEREEERFLSVYRSLPATPRAHERASGARGGAQARM